MAHNTCLFCDKVFPNYSKLKLHMNSHTRERPYFCHYCGASFINGSNKITHTRRFHAGANKLTENCKKQLKENPDPTKTLIASKPRFTTKNTSKPVSLTRPGEESESDPVLYPPPPPGEPLNFLDPLTIDRMSQAMFRYRELEEERKKTQDPSFFLTLNRYVPDAPLNTELVTDCFTGIIEAKEKGDKSKWQSNK